VWIDISGDFPSSLRMSSILVDWNPHVLLIAKGVDIIPVVFVGTESGVYFSKNLGR
jgi:hypothetical protein